MTDFFCRGGTIGEAITSSFLCKGAASERYSVALPVVLIVEYHFLIRMNAAEMIAEAGFNVVEAANADEVIVILETV